MKATIVIVTRDRGKDLCQTLECMRRLDVPDGLDAGFLIVDNASHDDTADIVRRFNSCDSRVRYIHEPVGGKTNGQNTALADCDGDMLLFTDDDVRPPSNWLDAMCGPIADGTADAVCGGVEIAPHLQRDWMTAMHRSWLACTNWLGPGGSPQSMVGANMAFSRKVLARVPGFDPELGPGALGFGDDHLFACQLIEAGYRIRDLRDLCVEHHCDPQRLSFASWLSTASKIGASNAYIGHHWRHWKCRMAYPRTELARIRLAIYRLTTRHPGDDHEGCPEKLMLLTFQLAMIEEHIRQSERPRNYELLGLRKLNGQGHCLRTDEPTAATA